MAAPTFYLYDYLLWLANKQTGALLWFSERYGPQAARCGSLLESGGWDPRDVTVPVSVPVLVSVLVPVFVPVLAPVLIPLLVSVFCLCPYHCLRLCPLSGAGSAW